MLNAAAVACIEQVRLGFVASVTSGGPALCVTERNLCGFG
jgi:hypothetical protein